MDQLLVGLLVFLLLLCDGPAPGRFTSLSTKLLRDGPAPGRFTSLSTITL